MPRARQLVTAALAPATAVAAAAALLTAGAGTAAAQPPSSTVMTCGSANPLAWAPPFTWHIRASSGASRPPGGELEPALLLSGNNDLPNPPASLFPIPTTTPYGTQVQVDWHNETTGASGTSVSDEEMLKGKPGIPVNRTWTGVGTVAFTVTARTGGGWWWLNTQNAVCRGTISVLPD